jgi:predicted nucleic acid-binding protein
VRFVDTNVLLYARTIAPDEREKMTVAQEILDADDLAFSVQVLQEFYTQATRSTRKGALTHEEAATLIEALVRFPVQDMTLGLLRAALTTGQRFKISYWDAAIIEAARALGCSVVLSEDLSDGQDYDGVVVRNPFR